MRVLLVEDDATTAASIKMMLAKENFICDTTDLGEDGLEIGKLYDYDIILLDLMLPDIDGYEVLRRLRAARVRTPILIFSGLGELDHKLKGLGFGADDFLTKPFDRRELVARIQAIVRRSKGRSESTIRTALAMNRPGRRRRSASATSGPSSPWSWTPSRPTSWTMPRTRSTVASTKTPRDATLGCTWRAISRALDGVTRRGLGANTNPSALAPARTAARASPSRVMPQILTNVAPGGISQRTPPPGACTGALRSGAAVPRP